MDFIERIKNRQEQLNLTDLEISKRTGIAEYTYYDLKQYKMYLTKVAYFSLCCVLDMPILEDSEIEDILLENRNLVGTPSTNLTVAAETVNPDYLDKLEKELESLKIENKNVKNKDKVIEDLESKLYTVLKEIREKEDSLNQKIQQAYSDGVREAMTKIPLMQQANSNQMIVALNEEYSVEINRLKEMLKKSRQEYKDLYNYIAGYLERNVIGEKLSISKFEIPYEGNI